MPVELAVQLYLSTEEFLYRRGAESLKPCLHPCSPPTCRKTATHNEAAGPPSQKNGKCKKQVSFADHKGRALTMVKVFSQWDDPIEIPLSIQRMLGSALTLREEEDRLALDFPQPASDYPLFRQRLEQQRVCLENCILKDTMIAGTIKVKNLSFRKLVKVRATFDLWKSFVDTPCQYVNDTYTGSDRDTFSFEISLPEQAWLQEQVEFAVCYEVEGQEYWDSNQGQNYRVVQATRRKQAKARPDSLQLGSVDAGGHFDRYGSPRLTQDFFPDWPSYMGYEEIGPYY